MKILLSCLVMASVFVADADAGRRGNRERHRERTVIRHRERHVQRGGCRSCGQQELNIDIQAPACTGPDCATPQCDAPDCKIINPTPAVKVEVKTTKTKVKISTLENEILVQVNRRRARAGLRAFSAHGTLFVGCRNHCHRQASRRSMGHARGFFGSGECVAAGQRSASEVVNSWMNSSGHRAILMSNARYCGASGVNSYWTLRTLR